MTAPRIDDYFVCVGAQKSGTTWLARILADHPELFLTPVKEIHYFDHVRGITGHLSMEKRRSRYRKYHQRLWTEWGRFSRNRQHWRWYRDYMRPEIGDRWYADLFRHRDGRRFAGEVTPEYAIIGREGFEHIRRLAPAARVLFIMRNPVERAWSQALHHARSERIDAGRASLEELKRIVDQPRFRALGDYGATLEAMSAVFPAEQSLAMFYEDIHKDRPAALEAVCRFIGIRFDPALLGDTGRRFNKSQDAKLPAELRVHLAKCYKATAEDVRRRLGRIPDAWAKEFGLP
ncbi:MAG TPA: sulfotransferase [Hyphomicrobiaceae bacterium]|nr:sulfotransferase [Hyphomicrobiaceae bacterium]